jgi:hypothetical protein
MHQLLQMMNLKKQMSLLNLAHLTLSFQISRNVLMHKFQLQLALQAGMILLQKLKKNVSKKTELYFTQQILVWE